MSTQHEEDMAAINEYRLENVTRGCEDISLVNDIFWYTLAYARKQQAQPLPDERMMSVIKGVANTELHWPINGLDCTCRQCTSVHEARTLLQEIKQ